MKKREVNRVISEGLGGRLTAVARTLSHLIAPEEWTFSFAPFTNEKELIGCFVWEYLREHPDLKAGSMSRIQFVHDLLDSFVRLEFRHSLDLFFRRVPQRVMSALLDEGDELLPWLSMSQERQAQITSTAIRPPLIALNKIDDPNVRLNELSLKWHYAVPRRGEIGGEEATYKYWDDLIGEDSDSVDSDAGADNVSRQEGKHAQHVVEGYDGTPDTLIAASVKQGLYIQPPFLINLIDYEPEELKDAVSAWIDEQCESAFPLRRSNGAHKPNDLVVALSRLAIMRLMNKATEAELRQAGLTQVDEFPNRDFGDERKNAQKIFRKYFALEAVQQANTFPTKASLSRRKRQNT